MSLFVACWYAAIGAFRFSLVFLVIRWCSLIEPHNVLYTYNLLQNSTFKIYYEGTPPNNRNNNEDRNAPITAYKCATNSNA